MKMGSFRSISIVLLLCTPTLIAGSYTAKRNLYQLPWEVIAEKFETKTQFCSAKMPDSENNKDENVINFALDPNVSKIILPSNIKKTKEITEAKLHLSRWQQNQWVDLPPQTVYLGPNSITTDLNTIIDGYYKLLLKYKENHLSKKSSFYAIVTADWKKDLLAWCQKNKEQIETKPDPQLIFSSIAISHFNNLMETASKSQALSECLLSALSKTIKAKTVFEDGNCPDLVIGLNKIRLKRFEGASVATFAIRLPETYDNSKKWPMLVYADSRGTGATNNYKESSSIIILWWHFPVPLGYEWKDYKFFLDIICNKINLDRDRIYVNGECGNGIASVDLGLKYPDQWAECSASLGNASRHLAGNSLNLPLIFVGLYHDRPSMKGYYEFAAKCFQYYGCQHFRYCNNLSTTQVRGSSVPTETRNLSPYRVLYTIESLANPSAYWVQIDGREDENFIASVDAIVWGQSILVKTNNIDAYTLNLQLAPLDCNRPVDIIENNKHLDSVTGPVFVRKSPKYKNATYVKNQSLHGPVKDIFTDKYTIVWKGNEAIEKLAKQLANSATCFADANLPANFINTHNIVFVGSLDESKSFAKITNELPVIIKGSKLTTNDRVYEGDFGTIFIYPNPLNPKKYIAVFSGTTEKALNSLNSAWQQIKINRTADIGIFEVAKNNQIKWLRCEKFDTIWGWHKSWDIPAAKLTKDHPKWKWRQWLARILREQLGADVMISEDPFESSELPDTGEFTLRDMSRIFRNDWIVKISLKGNDLRELLTVPFNDITSREVETPVIDGVSFVKQEANSRILCINELESEKLYTVTFPYKSVNGKRMGMLMKNYRLQGEGFFIVLLKDYLKKNTCIDLDTELDSMQLNIF